MAVRLPTAIQVSVASGGAAHFIKLTLRDGSDGGGDGDGGGGGGGGGGHSKQIPYVSFSRNIFTLLGGEGARVVAKPLLDAAVPASAFVCAEAWNAKRVCVALGEVTGSASGE